MTRSEVAALLVLAASYDRRTVGESDVAAWAQILADLPFPDCRDAVVAHYTHHRDWLMPSDIRAVVQRFRDDRLRDLVDPVPDVDPDDVPAYLAQLRDNRARIADGTLTPPPTELPRPMPALPPGLTTLKRGLAEVRASIDSPQRLSRLPERPAPPDAEPDPDTEAARAAQQAALAEHMAAP